MVGCSVTYLGRKYGQSQGPVLIDGEAEIELQGYDDAWVTSMVILRGQIQDPGLGLGLGVLYGVPGGYGYVQCQDPTLL